MMGIGIPIPAMPLILFYAEGKINRRNLLFGILAAPFAAATPTQALADKVRAHAANIPIVDYKKLAVDDAIVVPIEEFAGFARIKKNNGIPWVWFKSPSRNCWCKAFNPNYRRNTNTKIQNALKVSR